MAEHARRAHEDPYQWKWVLLGIHNALQALMVLALGHGDGLRTLTAASSTKWLAAYRSGETLPDERLDLFLSLFEKVKGSEMRFYVQSRALASSEDQESSVRLLHSLRNKFIHFLPGAWHIELAGLPNLCLDCLAVAEFLAWESGNISWDTIPRAEGAKAFQNARNSLELLAASNAG